jgi:hypothetical protein
MKKNFHSKNKGFTPLFFDHVGDPNDGWMLFQFL